MRLWCWLFGHRWEFAERPADRGGLLYGCRRCHGTRWVPY